MGPQHGVVGHVLAVKRVRDLPRVLQLRLHGARAPPHADDLGRAVLSVRAAERRQALVVVELAPGVPELGRELVHAVAVEGGNHGAYVLKMILS